MRPSQQLCRLASSTTYYYHYWHRRAKGFFRLAAAQTELEEEEEEGKTRRLGGAGAVDDDATTSCQSPMCACSLDLTKPCPIMHNPAPSPFFRLIASGNQPPFHHSNALSSLSLCLCVSLSSLVSSSPLCSSGSAKLLVRELHTYLPIYTDVEIRNAKIRNLLRPVAGKRTMYLSRLIRREVCNCSRNWLTFAANCATLPRRTAGRCRAPACRLAFVYAVSHHARVTTLPLQQAFRKHLLVGTPNCFDSLNLMD